MNHGVPEGPIVAADELPTFPDALCSRPRWSLQFPATKLSTSRTYPEQGHLTPLSGSCTRLRQLLSTHWLGRNTNTTGFPKGKGFICPPFINPSDFRLRRTLVLLYSYVECSCLTGNLTSTPIVPSHQSGIVRAW